MEHSKKTKIQSEIFNELKERTGITEKKDFSILGLIQPKEKRMNPQEWILIKFYKIKGVKTQETKDKVLNFLNEKSIEYYDRPSHKDGVYRLYVKILGIEILKEFEYEKLAFDLETAHIEAGIFGIKNKHQKEITEGFCYFNYITPFERKRAQDIFHENGIETFIRDEKKCNLGFLLNFKEIPKIKKTEIDYIGPSAVCVVRWIISKEYRKEIIGEAKYTNEERGVSTRGTVKCPRIEMENIKIQIKKRFGICIILQNSSEKNTDFFVLTNKKTTKFCEDSNCQTTVKAILAAQNSEPEIEQPINTHSKTPMVGILKKIIRNKEIPIRGENKKKKFLENEIFCEVHKVTDKDNEYKIYVCHGEPKEKLEILNAIFDEVKNIESSESTKNDRGTISIKWSILPKNTNSQLEINIVEKTISKSERDKLEIELLAICNNDLEKLKPELQKRILELREVRRILDLNSRVLEILTILEN